MAVHLIQILTTVTDLHDSIFLVFLMTAIAAMIDLIRKTADLDDFIKALREAKIMRALMPAIALSAALTAATSQ